MSLIFMGFVSCGDDGQIKNLEERIDSLQTANKTLQEELDAYKYSPAKLLADIRQYYAKKDYFNVKENMYLLQKYHPDASEYADANKIYKQALKDEEVEEKRAEAKRRAEMKPVERIMEKYDCSQDMAESILKRRVKIGMTRDMARAAWGRPSDINRTVGTFGVHEQWCYDGCYLYFEDGILTSWQN